MTLHEIQPLLGVAAGVLVFIDYLIYARSVTRERTKPNAATWIWHKRGLVCRADKLLPDGSAGHVVVCDRIDSGIISRGITCR